MTSRSLDTRSYTRARADAVPPSLAFAGGDAEAVRSWQRDLRARVTELLGGFPERRCDLAPEVEGAVQCAGYIREAVWFESRPGLTAFGYVLRPDTVAKAPAVVCVPGHGVGVDDLVGLGPPRSERTDPATFGYQHDMALQWVARGFAVLAVEPLGFGQRRDEVARAAGPDVSSCDPAAGAALLLSETLLGWRVWDLLRAVDYLETRADFDTRRLALCGISGGATAALFAAALEPRFAAVLLSGYVSSFRESIAAKPHCSCNYVPGLGRCCEMWDVAALVAPRPLFLEHGRDDPLYPVAAAREAFARIRPLWSTIGAPDAIGQEIFDGGHEFCGREGLPFVAAALGSGGAATR